MDHKGYPRNIPTVRDAISHHPNLAGLLGGLRPDARLDWPSLSELCRPGRPVDRLSAHLIILNYLRRPVS